MGLRGSGSPTHDTPPLLQPLGTLKGAVVWGFSKVCNRGPRACPWATCRGWQGAAQRRTGTPRGRGSGRRPRCLGGAVCGQGAGGPCRHASAAAGTALGAHFSSARCGKFHPALASGRARRERGRILSGEEGASPGTSASTVLLVFPPVYSDSGRCCGEQRGWRSCSQGDGLSPPGAQTARQSLASGRGRTQAQTRLSEKIRGFGVSSSTKSSGLGVLGGAGVRAEALGDPRGARLTRGAHSRGEEAAELRPRLPARE